MKEFIFYGEEHHQDLPLLLSRHNLGSVHSVFQNGFNIKMGESLIFIGSIKNGRLPFGIHLGEDALKLLLLYAQGNLAVFWKGRALYLSNGQVLLKLDLSQSTPFTNPISKVNKDVKVKFPSFEQYVTLFVEYGEPIGLEDLYVDDFLVNYLENQEKSQHELIEKITYLIEASVSHDASMIENTIRYFIGRGRGLTPSGDDIIVGLLAVHFATGVLNNLFIQTLKQIVETESITTDVSKEYIKYAINGKFSSVVSHIMNDLLMEESIGLNQHFDDLVQVGHSSGVDSAFGLLIGMLATRRKFKCQIK